MFHLSAHLRAFVKFIERYELNRILEKIAKAYQTLNPNVFIPDKYEIPSLIWPPPNEKSLLIITTSETTNVKVVS